jgi:hypothetical protein
MDAQIVALPGCRGSADRADCRALGSCLCDDVQLPRLNEGIHYEIVMQVFSFSSSVGGYSSDIDNQGDFS